MTVDNYQKIEKVRKPRVHIKYELEDGGSTIEKELPFVLGVMGDYSGTSSASKKPLKEKKFVEINGENFNRVMQKMNPELSLKVENKLKNDGSQLSVDLKFNNIEDFEPDNIAKQVEPLKKLLDVRNKLHDILSKADRSDDLEKLLEGILQNNDDIQSIANNLKKDDSDANAEEPTVEGAKDE